MKHQRTAAIIQARMGSSRLPGKVMMKLGELSVLGYLVQRLSLSQTIDDVVVATTTESRDDVIVREAQKIGAACFRGSESDVLSRYLGAAHEFNADIVVRVTADNPFTDPASIDRVVEHIASGYDYAIETDLPIGTTGEAVSMTALSIIDKVAVTDRHREHVTLYAKENAHTLRCAFLLPPKDCARPDLSFTVDHFAEYERVLKLSERLPNPHFPLKNLIEIADISS